MIFEKVEDAKKLKSVKHFSIKGMAVTVARDRVIHFNCLSVHVQGKYTV